MHDSKSKARAAACPRSPLCAAFGRAAVLLLAPLPLLLPGCDDPSCVFGGNCFDDGGPDGTLGTNPASVPADGELILPAVPVVANFFPNSSSSGASGADTHTPIVIVFSEAMSPQNLNIAFEVEGADFGLVPFSAVALIGDGRVLVMLPLSPLQPGILHEIHYRQNVEFQDRTGQEVVQPANRFVGSFSTAASPATAPKVVMTYPADGATQQSPTSEIVVVFDRLINATSVDTDSFVVTVDGLRPTFNPQPVPLIVGPGLTSDTRVYRYKSLDAEREQASFGTDSEVVLELSPPGNLIVETNLPHANLETTPPIGFTTLAFSAPTGAAITSTPDDAIGIDDISGPAELAVRVDFADAQTGDRLEFYLVGTKQDTPGDPPPLAALFREVELVDPFTSFTLTADEIDLLLDSSPVKGRFADGPVAFAFLVRRGAERSPVRVLDVDPDAPLVQSPMLDTVAPVLEGLGTTGSVVSAYRSDARDVVLVGRASEALRAAVVTTPLGTNAAGPGDLPAVTGTHASGLFVAAPVAAGIVPPASLPLAYDLSIYDRALNTAPQVSGQFTQLGASGPGNALPGGMIAVEVFDATTLAAIASAQVTTHANVAGTVSFVETAPTGVDGRATIAAALAGETILTVDAISSGYDLFTLDGVPTDRLGVPLSPNVLAFATASGLVAAETADLNNYTRRVADSRAREVGQKLFPVNVCTLDPIDARYECPFNGFTIRPLRIGAQSVIATDVPSTLFQYSALTFLKAFELSLPLPPAPPGESTTNTIVVPFLLNEGGLDPEELPIEFPSHVLFTANYPGLPATPQITVEATSPGLSGAALVGAGVAFADMAADTWAVRAAYPGAVDGFPDVASDMLGRLVESGTIDADLFLRAEVSDGSGAQAGARPRLSQTDFALVPPAAAQLDAVPAVANPGGTSFDLVFSDVLPDAAGEPGLYRVTLIDGDGLRWTIWRADAPDSDGPNAVVHVPYVGPGGTLPLAPGTLRAQVSVFAWPNLDLTQFLWSDVEREHDLYSHAPRVGFTPP